MSSPIQSIRHPLRRRWPLRRKLVISLVSILAALTVVIGAVSIAVQRQSLIDRLDAQLRISLEMTTHPGGILPGQPEGEPQGDLRGPPLGSLELVSSAGTTVVTDLVDESGSLHELGSQQITQLQDAITAQEVPIEVELEEFGRYRVISTTTEGSGGEEQVVVGQSLAEVDQTTNNLIWIFALTGLLGVAAASLVAGYLVRVGLRPLDRLAATAARVGASSLSSGAVSLPERVADEDAVPDTETGQLGAAFNQMLDNVEHSLTVRQESEERLRRFVADASARGDGCLL